jgi:hypothetical protein
MVARNRRSVEEKILIVMESLITNIGTAECAASITYRFCCCRA